MLGRRGPAQAAFTNPELLELGEMTDADVLVDPGDVELDPLSQGVHRERGGSHHPKKNVEILPEYAGREPLGQARAGSCCASSSRRSRSAATTASRGSASSATSSCEADDGALRARPTDIAEELECGLVFRSVGYQGTPLAGVPFDERSCVIPNDAAGRIDGEPLRASTRWAGSSAGPPASSARTSATPRRPSTRCSRTSTPAGCPTPADPDREAIDALLAERQPDVVSYAGWQAIDRVEREAGEPQGRPRVKLCSFEELLEAAKDATPAP